MKNIKGYTLLEIVVALGIFSVVATLIITAFASVSRVKGQLLSSLKAQQELRYAQEYWVRMARSAEVVNWPVNDQNSLPVSGSNSTDDIQFYYNTTAGITNAYGARFYFYKSGNTYTLKYQECPVNHVNADFTCSGWGPDIILLGNKNFIITGVPNYAPPTYTENTGKGFKFSTLKEPTPTGLTAYTDYASTQLSMEFNGTDKVEYNNTSPITKLYQIGTILENIR